MSKFLKALASVGLVELDTSGAPAAGADVEMSDDEARRIIAEARKDAEPEQARTTPEPPAKRAPPAAPPSPTSAPGASTAVTEGTAFDEIYAASNLRPSPFSAEKLIRLLDGLRAMDANTRRAAVTAMDAADDAWKIEDPVIDAKRKIAALESEKTRLQGAVTRAEDKARADIAARDKYLAEATDTIRKQIADLEQVLQAEVQKIAEEKANAATEAKSAREASTREHARLNKEIERLSEIIQMFDTPAPSPVKKG